MKSNIKIIQQLTIIKWLFVNQLLFLSLSLTLSIFSELFFVENFLFFPGQLEFIHDWRRCFSNYDLIEKYLNEEKRNAKNIQQGIRKFKKSIGKSVNHTNNGNIMSIASIRCNRLFVVLRHEWNSKCSASLFRPFSHIISFFLQFISTGNLFRWH